MAREKKITIKPFLNTAIDHEIDPVTKDWMYPLYFRIGYNRKSTKFRVGEMNYPLSFEDGLDANPIVAKAIRFVENIIKYELSTFDNEFQITDIGNKVRSYLSYVFDLVIEDIQYTIYFDIANNFTLEKAQNWRAITPVEKKIREGIKLLGEGLRDNTLFAIELLDLFEKIELENITLYEWLIEGKSLVYLNRLSKIGTSKCDYFSQDLLGRESLISMDLSKINLLVKKYFDELVGGGISVVYDSDSGSYEQKNRVFQRLV